MKAEKKPVYSQAVRSRWLAKRNWPFQISVITPTREWRISCGIYNTHGRGKTFEEAVDDAITNERRAKKGCCTMSKRVVTEIPEPASRQMIRAMEKMMRVLTDGSYKCCP